jgi:hypothetical protein
VSVDELQWTTAAFSKSTAMTLYLAARELAEKGRTADALDVVGDACRAQRSVR